MFLSRTWQGLKLCIWKTVISANPLQLNWVLLGFIIIFLRHLSTSLVLGYKRFWFSFPNVSPPHGVLANYLIMGYQMMKIIAIIPWEWTFNRMQMTVPHPQCNSRLEWEFMDRTEIMLKSTDRWKYCPHRSGQTLQLHWVGCVIAPGSPVCYQF